MTSGAEMHQNQIQGNAPMALLPTLLVTRVSATANNILKTKLSIMSKRLKIVVPTSQVAHLWANQLQSEARNPGGNFYFKGATIYSYGSHFPIATIVNDGTVLFTELSYSNTTAKHIREARSAVSHRRIVYIRDVPTVWGTEATKKDCCQISTNESSLRYWLNVIEGTMKELSNPRNRDIAGRVRIIDNELASINSLLSYFGEKEVMKTIGPDLKKRMKKALKAVEASRMEWSNRIQAAKDRAEGITGKTEEERQAEREKREAKMEKDWGTFFELWRAGSDISISNLPDSVKKNAMKFVNGNNSRYSSSRLNNFTDKDGFTRLRYNAEKNRVETSKNVAVPAAIAKKVYDQIKGCTDCTGLNIDVVGFTLTEANADVIVAGCHTIPQADVKYIAELLNWN